MLNIMRADFYRLRKSKILLGILIGFVILLIFVNISAISWAGTGEGTFTIVSDTKNLNAINIDINGSAVMMQYLRSSNTLIFFMIPIVLFIFVSDFKWKTIKNVVPFKYSRIQIYLAKWILCSILCCLLPFIYCALGLFVNQLINGFSGTISISDISNALKIWAIQLPIYLGWVALMQLIGIIAQSTLAVTAFTMAYPFVVIAISSVLRSSLFTQLEPLTCLDLAAYFPSISTNQILTIILVGSVLAIVSIILGLSIFKKKGIS